MLELSFETLDRFGHYDLSSPRPAIVDSDGRARNAIAPLDLGEVFSYLPDMDLQRPLPATSRIGHVHLHVADIEAAVRFYEAVGFTHSVTHPVGMAELHAGGSFPHRLALNIWQGVGAPPAPEGAAGMRHAVINGRDVAAAAQRARSLGAQVEERDDGALIRDPSGNRIYLTGQGA
jgi:catechol 2,3-dioxygenase